MCLAVAISACGPAISEQSMRLSDNLVALAQESYRNDETGDAIRKCLQALEANPDNPDATYLAGFLYASRGDYADAERYLLRTLAIDDTYTDARNTLGVVYNNQARYEEAVAVLERAADDLLYPTPHLVLGNLGQSYLEAGRLPEAIDVLLRSVREQPRFCIGYLRLGDAYQRRGDDPRAIEALTAAVGVDDPGCLRLQPAWRLLGEVRLRSGDAAAAAEAFATCEEIDPRSDDGTVCRSTRQRLGEAPGNPTVP